MILKVLDNSLSRAEDNIFRLDCSAFERTCLTLLDAGLYEDHRCLVSGGIAPLNGYAEWISDTMPALSVSFDWSFCCGQLTFNGEPFTNFTLHTAQGWELSSEANFNQIKTSLENLSWSNVVLDYLAQAYQ